MDNTSGTLPTHDSWSALQIPNSTGMGTLSHTTNSTSNSRWVPKACSLTGTTHLQFWCVKEEEVQSTCTFSCSTILLVFGEAWIVWSTSQSGGLYFTPEIKDPPGLMSLVFSYTAVPHCKASKRQHLLFPVWTERTRRSIAGYALHCGMGWRDRVTSIQEVFSFVHSVFKQTASNTIVWPASWSWIMSEC